MKRKAIIPLLFTLLAALLISGCDVRNITSADESTTQKVSSALAGESAEALSSPESSVSTLQSDAVSDMDSPTAATGSYTMADIKNLQNTGHFAKNTLAHIFDGTINSKGNATGYHYTQVADSKGEVIEGTESQKDHHGVFTAKVMVNGVKKNGFSSFYPEDWTPQEVVDAINEAYEDAMNDASNPHGSLWIGYSGDLEINMYLDSSKRITTAYPIYEGA